MEELESRHWVSRSSAVAPSTAITPPENEIVKAAEIINSGPKVTFLVGHGANGATDEVLEAARPRRRRHHHRPARKASRAVGRRVPLPATRVARARARARHQMADCDTLVLLGTNYPYGQFLPKTRPGESDPGRPQARADGPSIPHRGEPLGRRQIDPPRPASPICSRRPISTWQNTDRRRDASSGRTRRSAGDAALLRWRQPSARLPRAEQAATTQAPSSPRCLARLRTGTGITSDFARHDGRPFRSAGDHARGDAVRGGGEVRLSGPARSSARSATALSRCWV